jgi:hypothetical protein
MGEFEIRKMFPIAFFCLIVLQQFEVFEEIGKLNKRICSCQNIIRCSSPRDNSLRPFKIKVNKEVLQEFGFR